MHQVTKPHNSAKYGTLHIMYWMISELDHLINLASSTEVSHIKETWPPVFWVRASFRCKGQHGGRHRWPKESCEKKSWAKLKETSDEDQGWNLVHCSKQCGLVTFREDRHPLQFQASFACQTEYCCLSICCTRCTVKEQLFTNILRLFLLALLKASHHILNILNKWGLSCISELLIISFLLSEPVEYTFHLMIRPDSFLRG